MVPEAMEDGGAQLGPDYYHTINFNFLVVSFSPPVAAVEMLFHIKD